MLSVLIPVYNHFVKALVHDLHQQLTKEAVPFEIILGDDASDIQYSRTNEELAELQNNIIYFKADQNLGRSKMRNLLASRAQFDYLLFIDCDANIKEHNYISNYLKAIEKYKSSSCFLVNGGVAYRKEKPASDYRLRWRYGIHREQILAEIREKNPYKSFTPFNVLISKSVFSILTFDESITSYGNEDTLFGNELQKKNIPIFHINNALYHDGLEPNQLFLKKTEIAIDNLIKLWQQEKIDATFIRNNRLFATYIYCRKRKILLGGIKFFFLIFSSLLKRLLAKVPSLFWFDVYKLGYLVYKSSNGLVKELNFQRKAIMFYFSFITVSAASIILTKSVAFNEAPPISPPSIAGCEKSSSAFWALQLPPYRI